MNKNALDASEHDVTAESRWSRSRWLTALACMWMTFPLLASPILIDDIDPPSAPPGGTVTLEGSGFDQPAENYAIVVVGPSPTDAVQLHIQSIVGPINSQTVTLIVGAAEGPFQGDLIILQGEEIEINPAVFQTDDRVFAVGGSRFSASSCHQVGGFGIELAGDTSEQTLAGTFASKSAAEEPMESIWAQPMGDSLEIYLRPGPYKVFYTSLPHMIDPEDCGSQEKHVSPPGDIRLTYLAHHASASWELAEDLATALLYAFQDVEGVSVSFGGSSVTVELGREVRGNSMLLEVYGPD